MVADLSIGRRLDDPGEPLNGASTPSRYRRSMSTLDDWLIDAAGALSLPPDAVPADLRTDLLDLTRDVAHGVARVAGPLTCYLVGLAVARGTAPSVAVERITELARGRVPDSP